MIEHIIIRGYRCFEDLFLEPNSGMNILVGDNEAGKSTLLEAISLALTGKVNGRWAQEELNPFWFNKGQVDSFFKNHGSDESVGPPEILIELYFRADADSVQQLRGVHNSVQKDCPGVTVRIAPSEDYAEEFAAYLADDPPSVLPVEFYTVDWRDFSDRQLTKRPKELATSFIDSRTIRSTSGVDHHTKEMLSAHLDSGERARISLAHRKSKQQITDKTLAEINARLADENASLHDRPIGLQMDQSSRTSWETGVVPQVEDIPFAMAGQGQQAAIKVALAMSRTAGSSTFILIEEPENHLSYSSLTKLVARIGQLAGEEQQLFISTHNSFVANRLGLDRLLLLHDGHTSRLTDLSADTVSYFRKLPGYDTLRLVLGRKIVLVEGPSDEIVLERAFLDSEGKLPSEAGIDVISMGGITFRRALEVCAGLDRQAIALQDNDGESPEDITERISELLAEDKRELLVSDPALGATLEPQLLSVNDDELLREILGLSDRADLSKWMPANKTEGALRILDADKAIAFPDYITRAVALMK